MKIKYYKARYKSGFKPENECHRIEICNQALSTIVKNMGIPSGRKSRSIRADKMLGLPKKIVSGYLAGVFDGDGNFSASTPVVRLSSLSITLLKDCQKLLHRFGVKSFLRKEKNDSYTLAINGKNDINSFFREIPCIRLKSEILNYQKMTRPETVMGDISFEPVKNAETILLDEPIPVYNISVEKHENFICNGFVVHNCGRAGRPQYDKEGEAIIIAKNKQEAQELKERYILAESEPIVSKLSAEPVLRTHMLALVAGEVCRSKHELLEFFSKTFFAYQYKDLEEIEKKLEKITKDLEGFGFITIGEENDRFITSDFVPAFELTTDKKLRPTRIGKRVSELYIDPLSAWRIIQDLEIHHDIAYLMSINRCVEMQPTLRVRSAEYDDYGDALSQSPLTNVPDVWDVDYDDYLAAFKTSSMFMDWASEMTEDKILERYNMPPGELYNKTTNAEWLLYSARELAILLGSKEVANRVNKLMLRIKHGVKEELLPFVRIKGIGRVRARLLWKNKIQSITELKKTPPALLAELLGPNLSKAVIAELSKPPKKFSRFERN
jgi:helicase